MRNLPQFQLCVTMYPSVQRQKDLTVYGRDWQLIPFASQLTYYRKKIQEEWKEGKEEEESEEEKEEKRMNGRRNKKHKVSYLIFFTKLVW